MSGPLLVLLYTAFAILATIANLGTQRLVLAWDDGAMGFGAAIFAGTLVGLVLKYLLDKRYIFADRSRGLATHGRKFTIYTLMGVVTTLIFWGMETAFWLIWGSDVMRETGAVLGLAIGYAVKYRLDRRFVFRTPAALGP